ncbi:MAG TPA: DNA methyltransferase, partial [Chthonomonadales bacterium]|nr:DNA methyltransferase [Chthonomonadales bacterium]
MIDNNDQKRRSAGRLPIDQVLLGDSIQMMDSLPAGSADLIFADPPYNLQLDGELRRPDDSKVDAADDHWDQFASFADYDRFTRTWLTAARRVLHKDGTIWVIGSYHNIFRVGAIMMDLGFWILNDVVWIKTNPTPQMNGVRLCNAHETLIWAAKSKTSRGKFAYRDLKSGNEDKQLRTDWYIPVCAGRERLAVGGKKVHSTQKPEALLHRVIVASSQPGDIVLDPFCGTGTTAAVAKRLSRHFITCDREPGYVEAARQRVSNVTPHPAQPASVHVDAPPQRIPFLSLVEQGVLPAGTVLRLDKGSSTAVVNADGTISLNGLRGSIHRIGAHELGVPACNGWTHWHYQDHSGA